MYKLKFLSVVLFAAILAGVVVSCKDEGADPETEGKKAGEETCDCVTSVSGPNLPNHPSSPLPPADVNMQEIFALDLEDPAVFMNLPPEVQAYLMHHAIIAYLTAIGDAYNAYFMALGGCTASVAAKYEEYYSFSYDDYNPAVGFFSCFNFKNADFQKGFFSTAMICADEFPSF